MAVINQSPAGQSSVTLSGIVLDSIDATASPFWQSRKIVGSASVKVQLGGEDISIPTTGQIWPLGYT